MALPADVRRRWGLTDGGSVEVADLGASIVIVPGGRGGLNALLRDAIAEAGGYDALASAVGADEPELR